MRKRTDILSAYNRHLLILGTLLVMFALDSSRAIAQSATAPFVIRLVRGNGDTAVYTRNATAVRFGATLNATMQYHFGSLITPASSVYTCDQFYSLAPGGIGTGGGAIGFMFEYLPLQSDWGLSFNATFPDYRAMQSVTPFPPATGAAVDILNRTILTKVSTTYIGLQPQVRYNPFSGSALHLLFGAGIEIGTSSSMTSSVSRQEVDRAEVLRKVPFFINDFRYNVTFGTAWDVFGGVVGRFRMILTPGVSMQLGSPMYSKNNSSWNSVLARATFAIKFSPDVISEVTVPSAPVPLEPPPVISALRKADSKFAATKSGGEVAIGFLSIPESRIQNLANSTPSSTPTTKQNIASSTTAAPTTPKEVTPVTTKPAETVETPVEAVTPIKPEPPAPPARIPFKGKLRFNAPEVFSTYKSEVDTAITPEVMGYLDEVAKTMKSNSSLILRIEGHADNFSSSSAETQRVSDERALQVVRFMMSQGISRSRLLASGFGARNPVASNRTPQGRAANRRVEISIIRP